MISENPSALSLLEQNLGSCVHRGEDELTKASFDGLKIENRPVAVIRPSCESQVGDTLRIANQFGVPVTTRGAGSSLTGGATPLHLAAEWGETTKIEVLVSLGANINAIGPVG